MNATARASLIAVAAIVGACWAIPALLASVVPSDAGMVAMMALLYALLPITAVVLGLLAASSPRTLFWVPAALGRLLAVEGSQDLAFHGAAHAVIGYAAMDIGAWMTHGRGSHPRSE